MPMPYLQEVPFSGMPIHLSLSHKTSQEKLKASNSRLPKAKSKENPPVGSLPALQKSPIAQAAAKQ